MASQTYCPFLWMHSHVAVDGKVKTCCTGGTLGNVNSDSLENIWNGETMKRMRLQMLNNEKPTECSHCWNLEDNWGIPSYRIETVRDWGHTIDPINDTLPDGSVKEMKLQFIDFRFNNLCNFKCRTCYPNESSSIAAEQVKHIKSDIPITVVNDQGAILYEEIKKQYKHVKKIYFAGGEPAMQKEHFLVLKDLIELDKAKDITLLYSTNGSKLKTPFGDLIELWKPFKKVLLAFSIDGYGKAAEYWRSGTDWQTVENNIRTTRQYSNIDIGFHSVIGWPNVFNWFEFMRYCFDTDLIDVVNAAGASVLWGPQCFELNAVPWFKKRQILSAAAKLREYILTQYEIKHKHPFVRNSSNYGMFFQSLDKIVAKTQMPTTGISRLEWHERVTMVDKWRTENFFSVFPEHEDMKKIVGAAREQ